MSRPKRRSTPTCQNTRPDSRNFRLLLSFVIHIERLVLIVLCRFFLSWFIRHRSLPRNVLSNRSVARILEQHSSSPGTTPFRFCFHIFRCLSFFFFLHQHSRLFFLRVFRCTGGTRCDSFASFSTAETKVRPGGTRVQSTRLRASLVLPYQNEKSEILVRESPLPIGEQRRDQCRITKH